MMLRPSRKTFCIQAFSSCFNYFCRISHHFAVVIILLSGQFFFLAGNAPADNHQIGLSGLKTVIFSNDKGRELCRFQAEIAITRNEQERGLMFRKNLRPCTGMLFVYDSDDLRYFWMKNTHISLDMIFIDGSLRVTYVHHKALPLDETVIDSKYPARFILEVSGGQARSCNIVPGVKVTFLGK